MNAFVKAMIAFAKAQLGKKYVLGATGPDEWDCRGLVRKAARAAGLDGSVLPAVNNVRELTAWAEASGLLRLASSGYKGKRGDIFLWGKVDGDHRPIKGAGHTGLVLQPVNAKNPMGKAISAYNPEKGVIVHDLIPSGHHALYGFIVLAYPAPEPAITDPETPPPSTDAAPQPDEPPTVEELLAKISNAQEALA